MAWFKVDDQFGSHPKVMQIPRAERHACLGLWLHAGVWSAQHLTDGFVPGYMLDELGANVSHRDRLVTVGLWTAEGDGVRFNDWPDHQPTRAEVLAAREKERLRKEAYRKKKAGNTDQSPAGTPPDSDAGHLRASEYPDPTRPDPAYIEVPNGTSSLSKRGTRIDPDWMPDLALINQMRDECPGVDLEVEHRKFVDHWIAQPGQKGVKLDWAATWRNWIRRSNSTPARSRPVGKPSPVDRARQVADELRALEAQHETE